MCAHSARRKILAAGAKNFSRGSVWTKIQGGAVPHLKLKIWASGGGTRDPSLRGRQPEAEVSQGEANAIFGLSGGGTYVSMTPP